MNKQTRHNDGVFALKLNISATRSTLDYNLATKNIPYSKAKRHPRLGIANILKKKSEHFFLTNPNIFAQEHGNENE